MKKSKPEPSLHLPMQRSSSVSASPINSDLKSLSARANFLCAAERPREKDLWLPRSLLAVKAQKKRLPPELPGTAELSPLYRHLPFGPPNTSTFVWRHSPTALPRGLLLSSWPALWVVSGFYSILRHKAGAGEMFLPSPTLLCLRDPRTSHCSLKLFPFLCSLRSQLAQFKTSGYD